MIKQITFMAMGSQMMAALESNADQVEKILRQVPLWFEDWEQSLSRFRLDSELGRLNRSRGRIFHASETLWEVLKLSLRVENASKGLITPAVLNALEAAGYSRDFDQIGSFQSQNLHEFSPIPGIDEIILDEKEKLVILPEGVRLDFGGVAKGWAARQAVLKLQEYGPALMDAGGDIMTSSALSDGSPWPVAIADPFQPDEDLGMLRLSGEGVATSGQDYHFWDMNGTRMHHIIDVRTGRPVESDVYSATVIASDVIEAEMAAKMILILGSEAGLSWLENQPGLAGYIVRMDKTKLISMQLSSYLWSETCQI
jgi:thiamine biosynthesis lipoprotein